MGVSTVRGYFFMWACIKTRIYLPWSLGITPDGGSRLHGQICTEGSQNRLN
jgi:hypothetical protein